MFLPLVAAIASIPPSIIPRPQLLEVSAGSYMLGPTTEVVAEGAARAQANSIAQELGLQGGGTGRVSMALTKGGSAEGYTLDVNADGVKITASTSVGLFYGSQTLRQLLPPEVLGKPLTRRVSIPYVHIVDQPRFGWRGAMLDVARHYMPKAFIFKLIDTLALHKMNRFHFHLTDDQGWRMEIKRYPKLTTVGAWRTQTMSGYYNAGTYDNTPHGGFYSQKDLREIVKYAADRFITVIPEIEMPGHSVAAVAAYPELGCTGKPVPVSTGWGVESDIANMEPGTVQFWKNVLDEVLTVFPSKFIHCGGDEVPKTQWKASAAVQARMKELGVADENALQSWFTHQIDAYLASKGRRMIGWDEILEGGELAPGATVMSWRGESGGIAAAKSNHDVVMAPTTYTYLDYNQGRDRDKEPLNIGGYLPLKTVYGYDPIPPALRGTPEAAHILGAQCQLWTEYIPNPAHAEYMLFPRMCAVAESAWSSPERDFPEFLNRLQVHLQRLDSLGINYRPLDTNEPKAVASWDPSILAEDWKSWEFPISKVEGNQDITLTFSYTGGDCRLDIRKAELIVDGAVVSTDAHEGRTGGENVARTYRLHVPALTPGASVRVRAEVRPDGGTDSSGEVFLATASTPS